MSEPPPRLAVKGWTEFQHYKHRKPPWIRLYRKLLDDLEWHRLPVASRALAPMLWLLASETQNGVIDGASDVLAFRLRMASDDFEEAIKPLIAGGWFIEIDQTSGMLAPRLQHAPSESEFRVTESLTTTSIEPARGSALNGGSAPRARRPMNVVLADLATKHRERQQ